MKRIFSRLPSWSKRTWIILIIIALALGWFFFLRKPAQTPIEYTKVSRGDIKSTISASGVLTGRENAVLRFQSPGRLALMDVKVGQEVKQGDLIASLDVSSLSINLQQARNTLDQRQAELRKVYDDIHLYQYGNGGQGNVGTANETETQRATRVAAETAANNAFDNVKSAQVAVNNAVIYSPINGIVTSIGPVVGQNVTLTDIIAQVSNIESLYFDADVDEADIAQINVGQKVEVNLNAYPDKIFSGTVTEIVPQTRTTSAGATVSTARIVLDAPGIKFISGLNGQANITSREAQNVLTIPQEALIDEKTVYVKENNKPERRSIETGIRSDMDVEVTSGLSDQDEIVLNPSAVTKPGGR